MVFLGRLPGTVLAAFVGAGLMSSHLVAPVAAGFTALVVFGAMLRSRRRLEAWLMLLARKATHSSHPHRLLPRTCQAPAIEPLITEEIDLGGDCVEQLGQGFYRSVELELSRGRCEAASGTCRVSELEGGEN
jgi:hypothetical protein